MPRRNASSVPAPSIAPSGIHDREVTDDSIRKAGSFRVPGRILPGAPVSTLGVTKWNARRSRRRSVLRLPAEPFEPGRDRLLVPGRHVEPGNLVLGEQPDLRMLVAEDRRPCSSVQMTSTGDDEHIPALEDVVEPGVQDRTGLDLPADLFSDLSSDAPLGVLTKLQPAASQLPFIPFVPEQHDLAIAHHDALHPDGEGVAVELVRLAHTVGAPRSVAASTL